MNNLPKNMDKWLTAGDCLDTIMYDLMVTPAELLAVQERYCHLITPAITTAKRYDLWREQREQEEEQNGAI